MPSPYIDALTDRAPSVYTILNIAGVKSNSESDATELFQIAESLVCTKLKYTSIPFANPF